MSLNKFAKDIWDVKKLIRKQRCPLCDSKSFKEAALRSDGLKVLECGSCGLAYVDPRPDAEELSRYYDQGYFQGKKDFFSGSDYCEARDLSIREKNITGYSEIVSNLDIKGKKILEIGCATGALLCLLKSLGPNEVIGIDGAAYPIEYGRRRYGLDLRCATLESAHFPGDYFDLIIMVDVIEHVDGLQPFLTELRRVVRKGGEIFIITPNYNACYSVGNSWISFHKDFEHLHYLSPASLKKLCEHAGFCVKKWWTHGLPVALKQYPKIYPYGMHRFIYPKVLMNNLKIFLKDRLVKCAREDTGHNLCAILGG